tara:strand:- start:568 stop:729 length:162 start_codon:yes stop_codon:yes gene_type:complete
MGAEHDNPRLSRKMEGSRVSGQSTWQISPAALFDNLDKLRHQACIKHRLRITD